MINYKLKMHQSNGFVLCMAVFIISINYLQAQNVSYTNTAMNEIAKPTSKQGWIDFREEANLSPTTLFTDYKTAFGLSNDDEMQLVKTENDDMGYTHYRYQQYYKGIKIEGAEYIVHQNNAGIVYSASGKMLNRLSAKSSFTFNENASLEKAKAATGSKGFLWENADAERKLQQRENSSTATYFPKGELVWSKPGSAIGFDAKDFRLCWKFNIITDGSRPSKTIFVDASSGEVIREFPLDISCNSGSGITVYNGTQSLVTVPNGNQYLMRYDCASYAPFQIYNSMFSTSVTGSTDYTDNDNNWTTFGQQAAVQSWYSIRSAVKFYKDVFNRNGYNNGGASLNVYNNFTFTDDQGVQYGRNAMWRSWEHDILVGWGSTMGNIDDDFNTLDILGHEFTHAVTQWTANLNYEKESGALNESFSDIMGESVEKYITGTNDWLEGGQLSTGAIRSFKNPSNGNQPTTYGDTLWMSTVGCSPSDANDHCGVHTNSGVQNRWFYLLCAGDTGVTYHGHSYIVNGIGMNKARAIAYRNLTVYLTSNSTYLDAREGAIKSAEDLYGTCSNEAIQCANAWYACDVGNSLTNYDLYVCGVYPLAFPNDDHFYGINSVNSGGNGCGTLIMPSTYAVLFHAKTDVELKPGFSAVSGCHFSASIDPCAVSAYRAINETAQNSEEGEENIAVRNSLSDIRVAAYPNPFKDKLQVEINLDENAKVTIRMFDIVGKEIKEFTREENFESGLNTLELNTTELTPGVYLITTDDGLHQQKIKVTKMN